MADCPQLDLICIPGGFGVDQAMLDAEIIAFVQAQAKTARYVTSVCTGAFVLGAAGLLKGRRATTHWVYHADLAAVGAIPTQGRTVRDGNVFTGGGVTAGIDFALTLVAEIAGEALAQTIQLGLEYDPAPPVDSGSPDKAPAGVLDAANARYAPRLEDFRQALSGVVL
jgi:cyclohexyl-isocyanide hydratase